MLHRYIFLGRPCSGGWRRSATAERVNIWTSTSLCSHINQSIIERSLLRHRLLYNYCNAIRWSDARAGVGSGRVTGWKWVRSCQQDVVQSSVKSDSPRLRATVATSTSNKRQTTCPIFNVSLQIFTRALSQQICHFPLLQLLSAP